MPCSEYSTIIAENRKLRSVIQIIVRRNYENDPTLDLATIASILKAVLVEEVHNE